MYKDFINRKNFFIVNYGLYIILITSILIILSMYFIELKDQSILESVYKYYINKK